MAKERSVFAQRITELRQQREPKLSQYEAARRLGMSRGRLANYEQGSREPDFEIVKQFADFYNVTTDYLLGSTNDPKGTYAPLLIDYINREINPEEYEKSSREHTDVKRQLDEQNFKLFSDLFSKKRQVEEPLQHYLNLFSYRLHKERERKGYTFADLAEKIERSEYYVQKLELKSSGLPGQDVLNKLAEIFDVTRDYLCGYTDDPNGYGTGVYGADPKDLVELIQMQGPVMFDGETLETEEDKNKMIELMRLAYAMVKQQNKELAAKRRKKGSYESEGNSDKA